MTSIERGIGISNQRWGEKEGSEKKREGNKKRDILLRRTNQRERGKHFKGSRASKSEKNNKMNWETAK